MEPGVWRDGVVSATIDPATHNVWFTKRDHVECVASALLLAFPFEGTNTPEGLKSGKFDWWSWDNVAFVVNINFADLSAGGGLNAFNLQLEGGGGLGYRLGPSFALAFTLERMVYRSPQGFVKGGSPILLGPTPVAESMEPEPGEEEPAEPEAAEPEKLNSIGLDDDRFFRDEDAAALSFKFVFLL